jgi:phosphonate transport system permease protein
MIDISQAAGTAREHTGEIARPVRRWPVSAGRVWAAGFVVAVLWSAWGSGIGRPGTVNLNGLALLQEFWAAAVRPDVSGAFVATTARATVVTLAFAQLGTAIAIGLGLIGGVLISESFWRSDRAARRAARVRRRLAWYSGRVALGLPRGVHEVVWGLFLVGILGRDPMVGVLAIAIPFGAITAKVYAELIDEAAAGTYDALVASGSGRLAAIAYGVLPKAWPDLVSYAFYRLDCAIRSAVILGMIGAGGLGFQLALMFSGLRYPQMWTLIYALVLVGAVVDRWGSALRVPGRRRLVLSSMVLGGGLTVGALVVLAPDLSRLFQARTWTLAAEVVDASLPPRLPGSWAELLGQCVATLQMSLSAIAIGSALGVAAAFLAARGGGRIRAPVAWLMRSLLLVTRALSPPVWALLLLFLLVPGPLPGAVALGVYNFGVLGRLFAEVVENLDRRPAAALRQAGAGPVSTFFYATVPAAMTRFAAYSLYRWEIAIRETVVVGVVGAAGLGRLLEERRAAFDFPSMMTAVLALLVLSLAVDFISAAARRSWR